MNSNAEQSLELSARRGEQELFDKELKLQLNQSTLLVGQCTETAALQAPAW